MDDFDEATPEELAKQRGRPGYKDDADDYMRLLEPTDDLDEWTARCIEVMSLVDEGKVSASFAARVANHGMANARRRSR